MVHTPNEHTRTYTLKIDYFFEPSVQLHRFSSFYSTKCGENIRIERPRKKENTFVEGVMLNMSPSSSSSSSSSSNKLIVERFGAGLETSAAWNEQSMVS